MITFYKTNPYWSLKIKKPEDTSFIDGDSPSGLYRCTDVIPHLAKKYCIPFTDALASGIDVHVPKEIRMKYHGAGAWSVDNFYNLQEYMAHFNSDLLSGVDIKHADKVIPMADEILGTGMPQPDNCTIYTGFVIKTPPGFGIYWLPHQLSQNSNWTIDQGFVRTDKITYHYWVNLKALQIDKEIILKPTVPLAKILVLPAENIEKQQETQVRLLTDDLDICEGYYQYFRKKFPKDGGKNSNAYRQETKLVKS